MGITPAKLTRDVKTMAISDDMGKAAQYATSLYLALRGQQHTEAGMYGPIYTDEQATQIVAGAMPAIMNNVLETPEGNS